MDPLAALPQAVTDALARGWTVLTGNQRAARSLRHDFDVRQRALGLTYWHPAEIMAWDSWLGSLWRRLLLDGHASELLLSTIQEHSQWRTIIAADPGTSSLRTLDSLAELAASAWSRLHHHQAGRMLHAAANTTDTRAFARWAREFERRCLRLGFLTSAQLPEALTNAVAAAQMDLPSGLLLVGFDSMTPANAALLNAMKVAGCSVSEAEPLGDFAGLAGSASSHFLVDAPDKNLELLACANWLRERLREAPDANLAVIVPDIDADRAALDRVLRNTLAPELNLVYAPTGSGPFEFSLGVPLDCTPIGIVALDLLRWASGPLAIERVSTLLLSPHFAAGAQEPGASRQDDLLSRAEFDAFILRDRPRLQPQITPEEFASLVSRSRQSSQLMHLREYLRALSAAMRRSDLTRDRNYADWAAIFVEILESAGWAPVALLDSTEFQCRRKWEDVLDELASLDFDPQTPRVTFRRALEALEHIAARTFFAPESRHAPIQIMGALEAAGSSFDAIWFLRASDLTWPPVAAVHPLLPYGLQREFAMPGVDAALDGEHARHITKRLLASAPVVVFSYAQQTANGRQRPSPVLSHFGLEKKSSTAIAAAQAVPVPIVLDRMLDDAPISAPPAATLRGGASILEAQAACAFRAFAEKRLFSTAPDRASLGLNARDRGSVVHGILHDFWTQVRTQAALRGMTTGERNALLAQCVDSALEKHRSGDQAGWGRAYLHTERERLRRLLGAWLDFEKDRRSPFAVKASEEALKGVAIGPLRLDIRVDRVDETVPGDDSPEAPAEIILDYKTGKADPAKWQGDRPDLPQLPLYAVVSPAPHLAAVAFAILRPGKDMSMVGYQSRNGILPAPKRGHTRDLDAERNDWRAVLQRLAEDFHGGRAIASPKHYPDTCRYCLQRTLCRLEIAPADAFNSDGEEIEVTASASSIARTDSQP
jgi:ATP-dependent helicase/nuclease subunit B